MFPPPELKLGRGESILCPAARRRGFRRAGEGGARAGRAGRSLAQEEEKLLPPAAAGGGQLGAKELLTGGGRGESGQVAAFLHGPSARSNLGTPSQAPLGGGWMEPGGAFLRAQLLLQG